MSKELFARPDLEQYKRQAKELLRGAKAGESDALKRFQESHPKYSKAPSIPLKLHDAQWVLAREHGFPSWRAMQAQIAAVNAVGNVEAFLQAAVWGGNIEKARDMLALRPAMASADLYCACVAGEVDTVERLLRAEPQLAVRKGGPKGWEPILYVCFSNFLTVHSQRKQGERFVAIARRLLELGANPNSAFIGDPQFGSARESALYGASGIANHAGLTELLLKAGADPQDDDPDNGGSEAIYHTAEFQDLACMRLLFQYGVSQRAKNYCLYRQLDFENVEGTRLFLENGANPNAGIHEVLGSVLHHAILRGRSPDVIRVLVEGGADINAPRGDGKTPFALATRLGRTEVAAYLAGQGCDVRLSPEDRFIGACATADSAEIAQALAEDKDLVSRLVQEDHKVLGMAACENRVEAARLMLEAGLDITVDSGGYQPMHWAAWFGHPEMVALLLEYGAPLEATHRYGGTPLSTAVYASRHCHEAAKSGEGRRPSDDKAREANYVKIAEMLIAAGAKVHPWMLGLGTAALDKIVARQLAARAAG